jgi:hypothetical protein
MAVEVEQVPVENQSTAGKWILLFLALIFVAAAVYAYVATQHRVDSSRRIWERASRKLRNCKSVCSRTKRRKRLWAKDLG